MNTIQVSPIDLKIGDRVMVARGCMVEVTHIIESPCDIPGGIRVAACISRLVSPTTGIVPLQYFETPQRMLDRGCTWARDLPDGLYWNVQGNAHARVAKIIPE